MKEFFQVLVVEDDADLREAITDTLDLENITYADVENGKEAVVKLQSNEFQVVVSDVNMPEMDGVELLAYIQKNYANLPVILMTAYGSIEKAVSAMRLGAADYLVKPFQPEVLISLLKPFMQEIYDENEPIVADETSLKLLRLAQKVALSDASVMICGASGTGKEVLAKYVHNKSPRAGKAFVAINCAAIPTTMLEATLFGYEKGAFTGAVSASAGKFEQAQGGTLLLDEISEMPLELQAKLLRVLQEKEVERLGGKKTISLDVRVLATTNRNLKEYVDEGKFREDLYYRLNVFPLTWETLENRKNDIMPLAEFLLSKHATKMGFAINKFSNAAIEKLKSYSWPGNVRELENVIQRALILAVGSSIEKDDLIIDFATQTQADTKLGEEQKITDENEAKNLDLDQSLREKEFSMILEALKSNKGKKQATADDLGISTRTLRYKLAKMRDAGWDLDSV